PARPAEPGEPSVLLLDDLDRHPAMASLATLSALPQTDGVAATIAVHSERRLRALLEAAGSGLVDASVTHDVSPDAWRLMRIADLGPRDVETIVLRAALDRGKHVEPGLLARLADDFRHPHAIPMLRDAVARLVDENHRAPLLTGAMYRGVGATIESYWNALRGDLRVEATRLFAKLASVTPGRR